MNVLWRSWLWAVWLSAALLVSPSHPARACLGCWESMEVRVVDSPWIVVGEIQQVEPYTPPPPPVHSEDDEGSLYDWSDKLSQGMPLLATVKVIRTLKGPRATSNLKLTSYEHDGHRIPRQHGFYKGERLLLLVTEIPSGDPSNQPLEAEMLGLSSVTEVENQLLRAKQFQADYLQTLSREQPTIHAAALLLAGELRQACVSWPRPKGEAYDWQKNVSNDVACSAARDQLFKKLSAANAEVLFAAQAVDWFHDHDPSWSRQAVWLATLDAFAKAHPKEAHAVSEKWIHHALQAAGIEQPYADDYGKTSLFESNLQFPLQFDVEVQGAEGLTRENWTTHLLLCRQAYSSEDNWKRLMWYRPRPNEKPRAINLARLRNSSIPAADLLSFFSSADSSNIDLLVSAFFDAERDKVDWKIERLLDNSPAAAPLWKEFIRLGVAVYPEDFWDRMTEGRLFNAACVEAAVELLAEAEKSKPHYD